MKRLSLDSRPYKASSLIGVRSRTYLRTGTKCRPLRTNYTANRSPEWSQQSRRPCRVASLRSKSGNWSPPNSIVIGAISDCGSSWRDKGSLYRSAISQWNGALATCRRRNQTRLPVSNVSNGRVQIPSVPISRHPEVTRFSI